MLGFGALNLANRQRNAQLLVNKVGAEGVSLEHLELQTRKIRYIMTLFLERSKRLLHFTLNDPKRF